MGQHFWAAAANDAGRSFAGREALEDLRELYRSEHRLLSGYTEAGGMRIYSAETTGKRWAVHQAIARQAPLPPGIVTGLPVFVTPMIAPRTTARATSYGAPFMDEAIFLFSGSGPDVVLHERGYVLHRQVFSAGATSGWKHRWCGSPPPLCPGRSQRQNGLTQPGGSGSPVHHARRPL